MEGEGIQGKRKVLIMDSGLCTLCLYPIYPISSPTLLPSLTPLSHSELPAAVSTPSRLLPQELEHAVLFALSPLPSNNNMACSHTSSDCHLNSTFLQIIATPNKQESFFTLYHFTMLYFFLRH